MFVSIVALLSQPSKPQHIRTVCSGIALVKLYVATKKKVQGERGSGDMRIPSVTYAQISKGRVD